MAYNYEYPYTDVYRYNSDWILKTIDDLEDKYAEMLALYKKIQEEFDNLPTTVQSLIDDTINEYEELTDQKLLAMRNLLDRTIEGLKDFVEQENNKVLIRAEFIEHESISRDAILNKKIDDKTRELLQNILQIKIALENEINDLRELIESCKTECVKNPLTAEMECVCKVVNVIFEYLRMPNALSNIEIELDHITYGDIDDAFISYGEFATNSRRILKNFYNNPITGDKHDLDEIHSLLSEKLLSLTNDDIEGLDITYDDTSLTYGQWQENGVIYGINDKTLTTWDDFSKLKLYSYSDVITPTSTSVVINMPIDSDFWEILATTSVIEKDGIKTACNNINIDTINKQACITVPDVFLNSEITLSFKILYFIKEE